MRTTVTLDRDVERLLKDEMHRSRKSFKESLNSAIRSGLTKKKNAPRPRFVVKPQALGLRPGMDPSSFNRLVDDLEADAVLEKIRRHEQGR